MKRYIRSSSDAAPYAVLLKDERNEDNDILIYGDDRDMVKKSADIISMKIRVFHMNHPNDWTDSETDELMSGIGTTAQNFGVNFDINGYGHDGDQDFYDREVVLIERKFGNWQL